jgi:UDP-N-acetylglucosamine transferase subunit ALG13
MSNARKIKIFVNVGSTYPFDRLIQEMDKAGANKKYEIFLQTGNSKYVPKNCKYKDFFDAEGFEGMLNWADIIVSHAGAGSIIEIINAKKKLILAPRLKKYGEAVDDHQVEICAAFKKKFGVPWSMETNNIEKHFSRVKPAQIRKEGKLVKELRKIISN